MDDRDEGAETDGDSLFQVVNSHRANDLVSAFEEILFGHGLELP